MNSEYCFFDGKHNRCRGFITLTASVYHLLLRKQIPLATMEAEKENSANVELFWTLFNEALVKVAQRPVKFNPIGWCTDMAGANIMGISKVYGDPTCIKSCEFHFKDHRNKKAKKLDSGSAVEFKDLCDDLLHSTTTAGYDSAKKRMDDFISAKENDFRKLGFVVACTTRIYIPRVCAKRRTANEPSRGYTCGLGA